MTSFDLRSMLLATSLMGLMMSVVTLYLRRVYPPTVQGLTEWALAPAAMFVSTLMFGLRGLMSETVSVVVGNLAAFTGLYLFLAGSQRFYGRPSPRVPALLLIGLGTLVQGYLVAVAPDYRARVAVFAGVLLVFSLAHLQLVWRHGGRGFGSVFTLVVLVAQAAMLGARLVSAPGLSPQGSPLQPSAMQALYVGSLAFFVLALSVACVLRASERLHDELKAIATHDPLTGVLTRAAWIDEVEREIERSRRHGHALTLLILDLDHFKAINDRLGHQAGDRALAAFAARVQGSLRISDRLGRYGGEEFVVMLPETALATALNVAARIRTAVHDHDAEPRLSVSIGVAKLRPGDPSIDTVLARADAALYEAKRSGRNRVVAG